jgi:membrane associated rhomboid family serine protease
MTEADAPPTCYRHTDRETYVRCTRCDRPICPDCMNAAAVGFQCPECVREGNKSVRQARTVFGGRVGADANVTKVVIGLNVILFVAQLASDEFTNRLVMSPAAVTINHEWYRLLTSAFLHSQQFLPHILFNMYALLLFGSAVERLLGGTRYVVLYVIAAVGGSVGSMMFGNPVGTSLGASGAIFGLFGAYFVLARKLKADTSQITMLIGLNLVIGFTVPHIDNFAHLGGLVTGAAVAFVYTRVPRGRSQTALQMGGALVIAVALAAVAVTRASYLEHHPEEFLKRLNSSAAVAADAPIR